MEKLISEFHLRTGITSIVGRFFNAFGPNETNPHLIPEIQQQILAGARTLKLGNLDLKPTTMKLIGQAGGLFIATIGIQLVLGGLDRYYNG